jgi:glycine/D-amino acid oxidase-like deaminating enzyme
VRVAVSNQPYWQSARVASRTRLSGDRSAEVAIVGGGVGGLATAWHLADRGIRSTIVEARAVASGASGRNGGFLIAGAAPMYNDARALFGDDLARRIYAATLAAQREVYQVADDIGAGACFRRVGLLRLAVDAEEARHVRAHQQALEEHGFSGYLVGEADLPEPLRRPGRAGLVTDHDASLQPVGWLRALAGALERRGVSIFEQTPVTAHVVERLLVGPAGTVRYDTLVVAADGALGTLIPELADAVWPRRLHMIATAPLGIPHVARPVYARYGSEYHQQLPDGRIVLGGFSDLDGAASYTGRDEPNEAVFTRLARYLADDLGVAASITHRWIGTVGYTADQRPVVGEAPGDDDVLVLGGYCGTGNLCAWVGGRIVADLIAAGSSVHADLFHPSRLSQPGPASGR